MKTAYKLQSFFSSNMEEKIYLIWGGGGGGIHIKKSICTLFLNLFLFTFWGIDWLAYSGYFKTVRRDSEFNSICPRVTNIWEYFLIFFYFDLSDIFKISHS